MQEKDIPYTYYIKLLNNDNQGMDHGQRLLCIITINLEAEGLFTDTELNHK